MENKEGGEGGGMAEFVWPSLRPETTPTQERKVTDYIGEVLTFLDRWNEVLLHPHVIRFYSEGHHLPHRHPEKETGEEKEKEKEIGDEKVRALDAEWLTALAKLPMRRLIALPLLGPLPSDNLPSSLVDFIEQARSLSLFRDDRIPAVTAEEEKRWEISFHLLLRQGIKSKKIHEIDRMARLVNRIARDSGCDKVVDVGAGKGHLSRVLALHYGLNVLSLDRSSETTQSAAKRLETIQVFCDRKARRSTTKAFLEKNQEQEGNEEGQESEASQAPSKPMSRNKLLKMEKRQQRLKRRQENKLRIQELEKEKEKEKETETETRADMVTERKKGKEEKAKGGLSGASSDADTNEAASESSASKSERKKDDESPKEEGNPGGRKNNNTKPKKKGGRGSKNSQPEFIEPETALLRPAVMRIDAQETTARDIEELAKSQFPHIPSNEILLCGLHACGDLTSMLLRLFCNSTSMRALVLVGCCYNLITLPDMAEHGAEKGVQEEPCAKTNCWKGFPMSETLQRHPRLFPFSKTDMMLACQSAATWNVDEESVDATIANFHKHHLRAMLQVLLRDHFKLTSSKITIGPIRNAFTSSFHDYAYQALRQLKLIPIQDDSDKKEIADYGYDSLDAAIEKVKEELDPYEQTLIAWWCLKCCLAGLVESLILADRVRFVEERLVSSGDALRGNVHLMPLFDHRLSPRAYSIIATNAGLNNRD